MYKIIFFAADMETGQLEVMYSQKVKRMISAKILAWIWSRGKYIYPYRYFARVYIRVNTTNVVPFKKPQSRGNYGNENRLPA